MKSIKFFLGLIMCAGILLTSCSDDDAPIEEPPVLLTKVSKDGITVMELKYDIDRKLTRVNYHSNGDLTFYDLIDYDPQGRPYEMQRYAVDPPNAGRKSVFTTDNFGRIIKSENYYNVDNFQNPQDEYVLSYDPSGRLESRFYASADNTSMSLTEFTYGEHNNPVQSKIIINPGEANEYVVAESDFTLQDKPLYSHWRNDVILLGLSFVGFDDYVLEMFNVNTHWTTWNKDGNITSETETDATEHQFNSNGYLIRQVLTRHNLFKQEPDLVREMTYEYK